MVFGKVINLNQNDNLCAVLEDDGTYCLFKVLETKGFDIDGVILSSSDKGAIFIENQTKKSFHQGEIVKFHLSQKKIFELMKL